VAGELIKLEPADALGWVHKSFALHELKRTREARENLLSVVEKFPVSATLRYNLACYECQLGNLEQAKQWLEAAFLRSDRERMRAMALDDADLKPLWDEIKVS
jgi:hypothetical protein